MFQYSVGDTRDCMYGKGGDIGSPCLPISLKCHHSLGGEEVIRGAGYKVVPSFSKQNGTTKVLAAVFV